MRSRPAVASSTPSAVLLRAAQTYGTPLYLYDVGVLSDRIATTLSFFADIEIFYSLKANPSLAVCSRVASLGLGADVASAGELAVAEEANFAPGKTLVAGPYKCEELIAGLRCTPEMLVSIDSISEFGTLAKSELKCSCLLRLRPEFRDPDLGNMGAFSRFGIPYGDLIQHSGVFLNSGLRIAGFHVYSGSQILDVRQVIRSLRQAFELCDRAATCTGVVPQRLSLGGGFGIPYASGEQELNLEPIGEELARMSASIAPARISLELGRYLVGPCGWYITSVVAVQSCNSRPAVVVDGGVHHRADICGLNLASRGLPPTVLTGEQDGPLSATNVLGCLCLPNDVLAVDCPLPTLCAGNILAFPNSGAYGLSAAPVGFLGHATPVEVAVDGDKLSIARPRGRATDILRNQRPA